MVPPPLDGGGDWAAAAAAAAAAAVVGYGDKLDRLDGIDYGVRSGYVAGGDITGLMDYGVGSEGDGGSDYGDSLEPCCDEDEDEDDDDDLEEEEEDDGDAPGALDYDPAEGTGRVRGVVDGRAPPQDRGVPQDRPVGGGSSPLFHTKSIVSDAAGKGGDGIDGPTKASIDAAEAAAHHLLREEEERAQRAARKREKKHRRKERERQEAQERAARTARRKRERAVSSWRSRITAACGAGEGSRVEALVGESPFRSRGGRHGNHSHSHWRHHHGEGDEGCHDQALEDDEEDEEEELARNMEWLLPSCFGGRRKPGDDQDSKGSDNSYVEARSVLTRYIISVSFASVFVPNRDGRSAFHAACFAGEGMFVGIVVDWHRHKGHVEDGVPTDFLNLLCEDSGWRPLHYACASGSREVMETLLAAGVDLNARTDGAYTYRTR